MVTKKEADLVPFTLKRDERGNILGVRVSGPGGGFIAGSMQQTNDGVSYLVAGTNVTVVTQSNGQVVISSTGGSGGAVGGDLAGTLPNPTVIDLHIAGQVSGDVIYYNGTHWVRLGIGSVGQVLTVAGGFPSWMASSGDTTAQYVLMASDPTLVNNRTLTAGTGIAITDGGPLGNATVNTNGQVAMVSGTRFQGGVSSTSTGSFNLGVTGSLTQLIDGRSYIVAGSNVTVTSQSNGQITISATSAAPTAGDGIFVGPGSTVNVDGTVARISGSHFTGNITVVGTGSFESGISGSLTTLVNGTSYIQQPPNKAILVTSVSNGSIFLAINDSVVATLSGSRFSGNVEVQGTASFDVGLSGSLTRLTTGQSYIAGGGSVSVTSSSNGQIVISGSGITAVQAGDGIFVAPGSQPQVNVNGTVARISGSHFTGGITTTTTMSAELGFSGSLTTLVGGQSFIAQGGSVTVTSQSNGQIVISGSGITTLQAGDGIAIIAGSQPRIDINGTVARISGSHFTGGITVVGTGSFEGGISGSLTTLVGGQSYIQAGTNITVTSQSNGSITISTAPSILSGTGDPNATYIEVTLTGSTPNARRLQAGAGITTFDAGAQGNFIIAVTLPEFVELAPDANGVSGSTETVVGSMRIPSGTYTVAHAMLGNVSSNDTATLRLRQFSQSAGSGQGNIILLLTGVGVLSDVPSTGSVVLPTTGFYDFTLACSSASGTAIFLGGALNL